MFKKRPPDDWCQIQEGYGDLLEYLEPENPDSEVDKVVNFILQKNIQIRFLDMEIQNTSKTGGGFYPIITHLAKKYPVVKTSYFSKKDDEKIKNSWRNLIEEAEIEQPEKCFDDFILLTVIYGLSFNRKQINN
jgi:hypothetical protein